MGDWFLNLPILWMALAIFAAAYLVAACVYLVTVRLAVGERARAFKAFSPGMLPPLGIIFGLLVGFVAVGVWNDFDKAKLAVATEASALRAIVLLDEHFPEEQRIQLRSLINRHIDEAVNREWPAMAHQRLTFATLHTTLVEALHLTVSVTPQNKAQRIAQREIVAAFGYHEEAHLTRHDRFRARCRHHDGSHTVGCRVRYLALRLSGASRRSRLSRVKATQDANRPVGRHPIPRHPMPPGLEAEAEAHLRDPKR
jgi:hypothetical protein